MENNQVKYEWLIRDLEDFCLSRDHIYSEMFGANGDEFQLRLYPQVFFKQAGQFKATFQGNFKVENFSTKFISLHITQTEWSQQKNSDKDRVILKVRKYLACNNRNLLQI